PEFLVPRLVEAFRESLGLERRRHFRRELQLQGALAGVEPGSSPLPVMIENLSESGARVTSTRELELGTQVEVTLKLPGEPVRTQAQVIRCVGAKDEALWSVGLFFQELSDPQLHAIRRVVHED